MNIRFVALAASITAAVLTLAAPVAHAQSPQPSSQQSVPLIEASTLNTMMKGGVRVYLLDVRQPEEFNQGHIKGATLMPLGTLSNTYTSLPKSGKLVVYCRSGRRSAEAVQFLMEHGYSNAVSLSGGFTAWTSAGFQK